MEYRVHRKTGDKISVIGLGTGFIGPVPERQAVDTLSYAFEHGINYVDLATGRLSTFAYCGTAFRSVRKNIRYQVHFGANYETGRYGWSADLDTVRRSVDKQLMELKTDYIDYGFIHCIDNNSQWQKYQNEGTLEYLLGLKKQGVVRHIGLSTHTCAVAQQVLSSGLVEQLMFSINPGYDYHHGDYGDNRISERMALYHCCETEGIGISVMKPFCGGKLLSAQTSPFGKPLTQYQCIQYALDKPGVLTVLPGIRSVDEVEKLLGFLESSPEERDYAVLGTFAPRDAVGVCVYCNHCQPCPMGLDIGLINKYYDLAVAGDPLARSHYEKLDKNASDCISCGRCSSRCPFHVTQTDRMNKISNFFENS